jgi:hypothetical protein
VGEQHNILKISSFKMDGMILKIFSPNCLAKILAFFTVSFLFHWFFEKIKFITSTPGYT